VKILSIGATIKIIAKNVPTVCIALGGLMILVGNVWNIPGLIFPGFLFFLAGVGLQVLWVQSRK
jgi:hypothetical protein